MAYKPSESRYDKGGRVVYVQYSAPVRPRAGGNAPDRVRVKRVYLPADSWDVTLDGPKTLRKRRHVDRQDSEKRSCEVKSWLTRS